MAGDLQELVFRLSKVGQALDGNDWSTASSVLGDKDWVKKANVALNKVLPYLIRLVHLNYECVVYE